MALPATPKKDLARALRLVAKGATPAEASRELAAKGIKVSKARIYEAVEESRKKPRARAIAAPVEVVSGEPASPATAPVPAADQADDIRRINTEIERASRMAKAAAVEGNLVRYSPLARLIADLVGKRARLRPPAPPDADAERRKQEELAREVIGMIEQYLPDGERIEASNVRLT